MKKIIYLAITITAVGLLTGCNALYSSSHSLSGVDFPAYVLKLRQDSTNPPARVPQPIRLAVAQIGELTPPADILRALSKRPDLITSLISIPLPGDGADPGYGCDKPFPVIDYASEIQTVCYLAKESRADYIFLIGGNMDTWSEQYLSMIFDFTGIGGMIVPGGKIKLEGQIAGILLDTSTRQPVFFVNADEKLSKLSADMLQSDNTYILRNDARYDLVKKLQDGFQDRLTARIR